MNSIQEKYQKIMEVMSDKTLSFGCKVKLSNLKTGEILDIFPYTIISHSEGSYTDFIPRATRNSESIKSCEIIGHPLHIGDVLDWIQKICGYSHTHISIEAQCIFNRWKDKRLPLSPTDEELINYIYNIL